MPESPPYICAVITEQTTAGVRAALSQAAGVADIVELRLDYLRDFDFTKPEGLESMLACAHTPVILTCRSVEEGGVQFVAHEVRLALLIAGAKRFAVYCDIEAAHYPSAAKLSPDLTRLIVSFHNLGETPADLDVVYDSIVALPAAVHKIVTNARDIADSLSVLRLLDRARSEDRKLIAIAMGEAGVITRVLGPGRGSFLTYGSLVAGRESAAGQPTCDELANLYRVRQLSGDTAVVGLIGSPIGHSASPAMHNRAFAALGMDAVYLPFEVSDVARFFERFVRRATRQIDWNLPGLSVTIPHKTAVIPLLDELDATAKEVGAVNTVLIDKDRLIGYNTDVQGALVPLEKLCSLKGESCAVLGAGGAARAVVYGLIKHGARVTVFARDLSRARGLAGRFGVEVFPLEGFPTSDASVVINTTPVGMRGHDEGSSPVSRGSLRGRRIAYDLVYNPVETQFLIDARAEGCDTLGGLEMLIAQAGLQFELWTGQKPPIEVMRAAVLRL